MFASERDGDDECGSASHVAFSNDETAVQFHELLHESEADAAPFVRPSPCLFDPVESLEQPGEFLGWDTRASVLHAQCDRAVGLTHRNGDAPLERELEGVRHEVEHDLLPHRAIHENGLA